MEAAQLAWMDAAMQSLAASAGCAYNGTVFRVLTPLYANRIEALSGVGALHAAGRFHLEGLFRISYTGCSLAQAEWEFISTSRNSGISREDSLPLTMLSAEVNLNKVLDLTSAAVRKELKVTKAELSKSAWSASPDETITQAIGRLAHKCGFEAILTSSLGRANNLNLLPDNYLPDSLVRIINEDKLPPPP